MWEIGKRVRRRTCGTYGTIIERPVDARYSPTEGEVWVRFDFIPAGCGNRRLRYTPADAGILLLVEDAKAMGTEGGKLGTAGPASTGSIQQESSMNVYLYFVVSNAPNTSNNTILANGHILASTQDKAKQAVLVQHAEEILKNGGVETVKVALSVVNFV